MEESSCTTSEQRFRLQSYRGGLALLGEGVNYLAQKWIQRRAHDEVFYNAEKGRTGRDGDNYHITIAIPSETKGIEISADTLLALENEIELFDLGVGTVEGCYFVIILAPKIQKFRKQLGLTPFDLHITLAFNGTDVYNRRKDITTLIPPDTCYLPDVCATAERLLHASSSSAGRVHFHYDRISDIAMKAGYLFGAYYNVKYSCSDPQSSYDILLEVIEQPSQCNKIPSETEDYGKLVCNALNHNVYTKQRFSRLRKFFRSQVHTDGKLSRYQIQYTDLPRNFSFVTETLAGSSVPEYRRYFECFSDLGITDVITVMETPLNKSLYTGLPIEYHFFEVNDRTPPTVEQMKQMMNICAASSKVLVHCQGGVGRTATVLAAYLMWFKGMSRSDAKDPLYAHRKTILADSQDSFLCDWYEECLSKQLALPEPFHSAVPKEKLPSLIMCMGYPSSGKSTFAEALSKAFPDFVTRINQDEIGRRECEKLIGAISKKKNHTVILDRCNLTKSERAEWIALAHCCKAWVLFFTAPVEECKWRIVRRTGHPTIKQGSGGRKIESLVGSLEEPSITEGFEKIIQIPTFDACNMLLNEWGCTARIVSTIPEEEGMRKFPRTRHVLNLGAATRDDLVMTNQEVTMTWLNNEILVEEKIDGANM